MIRTLHRVRGASALGARHPGDVGPFGPYGGDEVDTAIAVSQDDDGQDDEDDDPARKTSVVRHLNFRPSPGGRPTRTRRSTVTVNLDLPEITDEDIRQQIANQLDHCQHETTPFTPAELEAVTRYARSIQGIADTFDSFDADSIREFRDEFGDRVHAMLRGHFRLIGQWQDAYTVLKLDALPRDDEGAFSPAAVRFLGRELVDLQNASRALHTALAEYVLGKDENGYPYGSLAPSGGYRHVDGMFWIDPA